MASPRTYKLNTSSKKHLLECSHTEIQEWVCSNGFKKFNATQLREWVFANRAQTFADCSNLSQKLRDELNLNFTLWTTEIAKHSVAEDGTEKLLLKLEDGGLIECVLLREGDRRTICISSQVGCAMGCVFCASGLDGVDRNLNSGEIIEQILRLQSLLPAEERLSHIVMMGMGEPLANVKNLLTALETATDPTGFGISARRITISTVGLAKAIKRLAECNSRYQLAVSLHAPNDELRNEIVPVNVKTSIAEILDAADHYFEVSGRRLTYEYVLLANINDQHEHAQELAHLLRGRNALLNIIPYNPVAGLPYKTPTSDAVKRFCKVLEDQGVVVKCRHRKGDKINAACGQLRRGTLQNIENKT